MWIFPVKRNKFLLSLREGDVCEAKVDELLEGANAIVNFRGNLVRVKNNTSLKTGDRISLRVKSLSPDLVFEVIKSHAMTDRRKSTFEVTG